MLRVTVEMIPHGNESKKTLLGIAEITLTRISHDNTIADYNTKVSHTGKWYNPRKWWKTGTLQNFQRLANTPWELIALAIYSTHEKENECTK